MKKIITLFSVLSVFFSCSSQENKAVKKLEVSEFKEHLKNQEVQLIDVRTSEEYKQGAISNAKLINFFAGDFKEKILELDKEQPVYLYCRSGNRSGKASKILADLGFKEIYDLKGGYKVWVK